MLETFWTIAKPLAWIAWGAGCIGFVWSLYTIPYKDEE